MHSSAKSQMVDIINDMHWKLEQLEVDLKHKIASLEEYNYQDVIYFNDNRAEWMEKLVVYMNNGLTYHQAVQLICDNEKMDYLKASKFFEYSNGQRIATNTFAKFYCIKKLTKAGFKQKQIAEILGVCANTVYKIGKIDKLEKQIIDKSYYKPPKEIKTC